MTDIRKLWFLPSVCFFHPFQASAFELRLQRQQHLKTTFHWTQRCGVLVPSYVPSGFLGGLIGLWPGGIRTTFQLASSLREVP